MKLCQAHIVSYVIVALLAIAFAGTGYVWIKPLIEKRSDKIKVEALLRAFDPDNPESLPRKIEEVANTHSTTRFTFPEKGAWIVSEQNNSFSFTVPSKISNVAVGTGWVSYTPGVSCPPQTGEIGESPFAVCIRARKVGSIYELYYKVTFRELFDETSGKTYKVQLKPCERASGYGDEIVIRFLGVEKTGNHIITKVALCG